MHPNLFLPLGIEISETRGKLEVRKAHWARYCRKDLIPNRTELDHPYKDSSLLCACCGKPLTGDPEEQKNLGKNEKGKKIWDIPLLNLYHENPQDEQACPINALLKEPYGHETLQLQAGHIICDLNQQGTAASEDDEQLPKLTSEEPSEDAEEEILKERSLPTSVIRPQPHQLEETLLTLPKALNPKAPEVIAWIQENPEMRHNLQVDIWIYDPRTKDMLCGYVIKKEGMDFDYPELCEKPIYLVDNIESLQKGEITTLPITILSEGPEESSFWAISKSIKEIKKERKLKLKAAQAEALSKLPREEIWKGFSQESDAPEYLKQKTETGNALTGFKVSGDKKQWWLPGLGNPNAKIWILGLYPSNEEIKRKEGPRILAGATGEELFSLIKEAGLKPEDVYLDNMIKRYMPPKVKLGAEIKEEQTWLLRRQLSHYKPERVICLGAEIFKEIGGSGRKFAEARGSWVELSYPEKKPEEGFTPWTGRVSGTYHPAFVLRPEGRHHLETFRHDFKELLLDRTAEDVKPNELEIRTLSDLKTWVSSTITSLTKNKEKAVYVIDTEGYTIGYSTREKLVCIQIAVLRGTEHPATAETNKPTFEPKSVDKTVALLILREQPEPERIEPTIFTSAHNSNIRQKSKQLELLPEDIAPKPEEKEAGPTKWLYKVANTPEERTMLMTEQTNKNWTKGLVLFKPYERVDHLSKYEKEVGQIINLLLTDETCHGTAFTNANHDRSRLENPFGIHVENCRNPVPYDTMIAEHCLDENGELGLKPCLSKHFGWPRQDIALDRYKEDYKLKDIKGQIEGDFKTEWRLYPWTTLRPYSAKDPYGAGRLLAKQLVLMEQQKYQYQEDRLEAGNPNTLTRAFHISLGALNGAYEMHKEGMPVGPKGLEILKELTAFYAKHKTRMIREYQETVFKLTGFRNANPTSSDELAFVLFDPNSALRRRGITPWKESGKGGKLYSEMKEAERTGARWSTDAESLEIIASNTADPELQKFLIKLSETKTILTICEDFLPDFTYATENKKGIAGRLNMDTLMLHTTYMPTLDTNRCRSVPNLSTFPKKETKYVQKILGEAPPYTMREIIQAPEGAWLLNRDWTTAEVLTLGYLSEDPAMMEIISHLSEGMDFHCKLATKAYPIIGETFERIHANRDPQMEWISENFKDERKDMVLEAWKRVWENGEYHPLTEGQRHQITKDLFEQERSNIKPVTFGVPYGRTGEAIQKSLNREYYVENVLDKNGNLITVSKEEAQAMVDSYKSEFHVAWGYLVGQAEHALAHGFLRDEWGYLRRFPAGMKKEDVTRKSYNYQIQHGVAVLMNQAMYDWTVQKRLQKIRSYCYATLYDNLGWVVYEDELQKVWDVSQEIMTENRPVGPADGSRPQLAKWRIPTDAKLTKGWDGKATKPSELGIQLHPEKNLTGLEA
jgi:uracil-DNA glycosylase family 4